MWFYCCVCVHIYACVWCAPFTLSSQDFLRFSGLHVKYFSTLNYCTGLRILTLIMFWKLHAESNVEYTIQRKADPHNFFIFLEVSSRASILMLSGSKPRVQNFNQRLTNSHSFYFVSPSFKYAHHVLHPQGSFLCSNIVGSNGLIRYNNPC